MMVLAFALATAHAGADEAQSMRSASIALGRWQADAVCGAPATRKRVAFLIAGLVRTLPLARVHRSIAQYGIDAMGVDAAVFLELKSAGTGRLGFGINEMNTVIEVDANGPSADKLHYGDKIVAVNGALLNSRQFTEVIGSSMDLNISLPCWDPPALPFLLPKVVMHFFSSNDFSTHPLHVIAKL